jgi:hypothetical protein
LTGRTSWNAVGMEGILPDVLAAALAWVLAAVGVLGELRDAA